jgi:hypothetical protein
VNLSEITNAERSGWQRRAAAELAAILDAHRDLPVLAWTVGPAGATLVGQVNAFAPEAQVRQVFHTWRTALAVPDPGQATFSDGTVHLRAMGERDRVRIVLTATILDSILAADR